jgi:hypothetical protein
MAGLDTAPAVANQRGAIVVSQPWIGTARLLATWAS